MQKFLLLSVITVFLVAPSEGCKGCLSLDEFNFDKVLSKFDAVLVKFDVAYPYGDKHDAFTKLAEELSTNKDLIVAQVGVKDYGNKENEEVALKFGVKKEDFPSLRLFIKGKAAGSFLTSEEWSLDNLRVFIRANSNIYIGLPGCLERFDKLAAKFISASDKKEVLKETHKVTSSEEERPSVDIYIKYMKKILDGGVGFVDKELERLGKILKDSKVSDKKKTELGTKINILRSFAVPQEAKEEL